MFPPIALEHLMKSGESIQNSASLGISAEDIPKSAAFYKEYNGQNPGAIAQT